jgi:hypothetical protein
LNRGVRLLVAFGLAAAVCWLPAWAQAPSPAPASAPVTVQAPAVAPGIGDLKPLGDERFQIGRIIVDKRAGSFTVPGRVHVLGKPLEYLATTPRGMKEYETLLELDASGSEFNLACILIGLERDPKLAPYSKGGRTAVTGPRVAISVAWSQDGKRRQLSAAEALFDPASGAKPEKIEWVYTGSRDSGASGRFAADVTGTLVGFVHDPATIIETSVGVGIGAYGSVRGNPALPPVGSAIEMIVEATPAK